MLWLTPHHHMERARRQVLLDPDRCSHPRLQTSVREGGGGQGMVAGGPLLTGNAWLNWLMQLQRGQQLLPGHNHASNCHHTQ